MTPENSLKETVFRLLTRVSRPSRYIGGELNLVRKNPAITNVSVCLAFPDIYDIGQSYLGFHILYHVLNRRPGTLCERTFAPWPDMEELMRSRKIPLWSLENFLPVSSFDIVGFTLQYELHYTAVLNMLDLAGIPVFSKDRGGDDPLVLGGGTCCTNPEPVADFFDAFLLGDGEEGFPEILDVVEESKRENAPREEILRRLAGVEGVYVPSFYRPVYGEDGAFAGVEPLCGEAKLPVRSRIVEELKPEYYPDRPLVPLGEVVHDRLAVEIMRGCTRGCRFCEAGMSYRPLRIRPVRDVVAQVVGGIRSTGWDEVSLVSLSTTDYPGLETAVEEIGKHLGGKAVSISLSSLRADNFSLKMAEAAAGGRKTGLTFAVEAGTQRLRDVINKNLTEEQLFETVKSSLEHGFTAIKLYFMIGLPTETDEDVLAIPEMLNRLGRMLKKYRGGRMNVTVSPFSPKPVTPFQWENQDSVKTLRRKQKLIFRNLRTRAVRVKVSNPLLSVLECRLARGGRELAPVLLEAWKRGSRLDGWSEHFDGSVWLSVFSEAGIDIEAGGGGMEPGKPLPWGHIHFGVDERYLLAEREKAFEGVVTPDCRESCHGCGPYVSFCDAAKGSESAAETVEPTSIPPVEPAAMYGRRKRPAARKTVIDLHGTRLRIKYSKNGPNRFTSHLDLVRIFDRTLRRSGIPVAYSQGFHPHPKISFGHPLPLGCRSEAEYVDISLTEPFPGIGQALRRGFPEGIGLVEIRSIPDKTRSLTSIVSLAEYFVRRDLEQAHADIIDEILGKKSIVVSRVSKKGERTVDIRRGIKDIRVAEDMSGFTMLLRLDGGNSVKPSEVLELIFPGETVDDVTRIEQYAVVDGELVSPMKVLW